MYYLSNFLSDDFDESNKMIDPVLLELIFVLFVEAEDNQIIVILF